VVPQIEAQKMSKILFQVGVPRNVRQVLENDKPEPAIKYSIISSILVF